MDRNVVVSQTYNIGQFCLNISKSLGWESLMVDAAKFIAKFFDRANQGLLFLICQYSEVLRENKGAECSK